EYIVIFFAPIILVSLLELMDSAIADEIFTLPGSFGTWMHASRALHRHSALEKKILFFFTDHPHFHIGDYGLEDGTRNIHFAREFYNMGACVRANALRRHGRATSSFLGTSKKHPWSMPSPYASPPL